MGDFHKAFEAIDEDGSGEITVVELQHYMIKNNYKPTFVSKWLKLFDVDNSGIITYKHYCETLGLVPKGRVSVTVQPPTVEKKEEPKEIVEVIRSDKGPASANLSPSASETVSLDEVDEELIKEIIENQSTMEIVGPNQTKRQHKSKERNKEIIHNSHATLQDEDVEMEECTVKKRTLSTKAANLKQTNGFENNIQNKSKTKVTMETEESINNDTIMEKVVQKKETKKANSAKKQIVDNSDSTKKIKDNAPPILKASEPKKEEPVIEKVAESKESKEVEISNEKGKPRSPKSYPIQVKKKAPRHRRTLFSKHKRNIRASVKPGVVLILLIGAHKGKRVVFLKQLASGLLLVTGPFKLNGCPLRRVHQDFVIATKTQIDISQINLPEHINDAYFGRENKDKQISTDVSNIFAKTKKEYVLKDERKRDQMDVDKKLITAIKTREDKKVLVKYLKSMFSLSSHDCPHSMVF